MKNVATRNSKKVNKRMKGVKAIVWASAFIIAAMSVMVLNSVAGTSLGMLVKIFPIVTCTLSSAVVVGTMK